MKNCEHCTILRQAMEEIRAETFQNYVNQRSTIKEKLASWAAIQAIAAHALRETDEK